MDAGIFIGRSTSDISKKATTGNVAFGSKETFLAAFYASGPAVRGRHLKVAAKRLVASYEALAYVNCDAARIIGEAILVLAVDFAESTAAFTAGEAKESLVNFIPLTG